MTSRSTPWEASPSISHLKQLGMKLNPTASLLMWREAPAIREWKIVLRQRCRTGYQSPKASCSGQSSRSVRQAWRGYSAAGQCQRRWCTLTTVLIQSACAVIMMAITKAVVRPPTTIHHPCHVNWTQTLVMIHASALETSPKDTARLRAGDRRSFHKGLAIRARPPPDH